MPRHCSAGGCKSRDNRETRNAGITFHKLPKGATRRNLWITNSHRADSWDPQTDFVYFCSKHFSPDSFELTGSCSGIRRLKEDAFPTVFDSSSTTKCKRAGPAQRREDSPARKSPRSGDQEDAQRETDGGQTSEEVPVQRSAAEETGEDTPASSQETSGTERQESSPSPAPVSRPLSPSRYMRRLPPPPGFYLPKEHSYAQLCPLLWRRRYDQAIDCLEKALRQLHAARRRENRLRSTVLKLRDKRLKHALLVSQDAGKNKGGTQGGEKRRGKQGSNQEESETDAKSEDAVLFEDRCVDQLELGLPDTNSWSEDEKGRCFYCGGGQAGGQTGGQAGGRAGGRTGGQAGGRAGGQTGGQAGGQTGGRAGRRVAHRGSKTGKGVRQIVHDEDSLKNRRSVETKDRQMVRLERLPGRSVETVDSSSPGLQHVSPPDIHEQSLLSLGSQQKLSDMSDGETEAVGQEHQLDQDQDQDQQQQLFWIQDSAEGQVILVPVPTEDGLQSFLKMEGADDEAQAVLVSELDVKGDSRHIVTENSRGLLSRGETVNSTPGETGEDVREKLKEHLEGFHLQLSTEFIN